MKNTFISFVITVSILAIIGEAAKDNLGTFADTNKLKKRQISQGKLHDSLKTRQKRQLPSTCTAEFQTERSHTMCLNDDVRVVSTGVTLAERQLILDMHNDYRATVQPPAADLARLEWDDNLAVVAAKWSRQCVLEHDTNRKIPGYGVYIGQNLASGYLSWRDAIKGWHDEVVDFRYGLDPEVYLGIGGFNKIGHYTQMMCNATVRVGCGFAECVRSRYTRYYACNYAIGQSSKTHPYTIGDQCSACPFHCRNGLCDCGGKLCKNGGTLDLYTCQCECNSDIYSGDDCSILTCPAEDPYYCGRQFTRRDCSRYSNVPHLCPYMCGICDSSDKLTHETFQSPYNCTYRGPRPSKADCATYGTAGRDTGACGTNGGPFHCDACKMYANVETEYCPVMCGLCDVPCEGKTCQHGGTLDQHTCQCACPAGYTGHTCDVKADCPAEDKWMCVHYQRGFCDFYKNVADDCPHMCGLC